MKRLCGSGVMGQSELAREELGKGGRPEGRGLGCLKLLLSEKSDWDSAAAPSKGERAVRSDKLMGTTRLGLVKPGGGEGESLVGIWEKRERRGVLEIVPIPFIYMEKKKETGVGGGFSPVVKSLHLPYRSTPAVCHWDCR